MTKRSRRTIYHFVIRLYKERDLIRVDFKGTLRGWILKRESKMRRLNTRELKKREEVTGLNSGIKFGNELI